MVFWVVDIGKYGLDVVLSVVFLSHFRYDLFYMDDDEQDPFEQLKQKKQKNATAAPTTTKKAATTTATPAGQVINTNLTKSTNVNNNNNNKTAEKENKMSASNKSNQNNEQNKTGSGQGGKSGSQNAQRSKTGIKETQNLKTQDNRGPREGKSSFFLYYLPRRRHMCFHLEFYICDMSEHFLTRECDFSFKN